MDPADALAQQLDSHRRHVLDAAAGKEASSWTEVAAAYGVQSPSPTPEALEAVGKSIVEGATAALKGIEKDADPRRVAFLKGRLEKFAADLPVAHKQSSGSKLGLGGIFANATAHAGWTGGHGKIKRVIKCRNCGAPQQEARVFVCSFCGGPVFATDETTSE
ncbi:MAG: hypothetical protein JJ863_33975 [Deltaproteobacteria bacterium]|nr:hypothetical protein [Deltaproteobacteria bacterium]